MTSEWRTIDSAPRDGAAVLIWNPSSYQGKGGVFVGIYFKTRDHGMQWICHPGYIRAEPTHWMPLPAPPGSAVPIEAVGWRWRGLADPLCVWVHWGSEPKPGVNLADDVVIGRDIEVQPLYAVPPSPPRDEDLHRINADHTRLTACLIAMSNAGPNVTAEALRSVAYDAVMNLIPADVAEHQLNARSTSPPRDEIVEALREANFLVDRLSEFEWAGDAMTDEGAREWHGHVSPSLVRLRNALASIGMGGEK